MKQTFFILLTCLTSLLSPESFAQDSLNQDFLHPLSYTFQVENGKLTGEGADFLKREVSKAQFTMIGEYHGSKRISELTEALIPELDRCGYKTLVLEVGPISGQILNAMSGTDSEIIDAIRQINEQYLTTVEDQSVFTPIPFFENVEDARFLAKAKEQQWQVLGIDQEFYFGFTMLADKMYGNLPQPLQLKHKALYRETIDSLHQYYQDDQDEKERFSVSVTNSKTVKAFLKAMSDDKSNEAIIEAFNQSLYIYWLNATKKWYENNGTRINYMKQQLREGTTAIGFDMSKDKLLIKMGGYHLSKGFSPLAFYEVGNTLNEIAAFHGHSCLNITFSSRFYMENDTIVDVLDSTNQYRQRSKAFNQLGKKEEWVLIDLRPLLKGYHYWPRQFLLNEWARDMIERYDILVIPKCEMDPTPNYKVE